ncbi:MAG TPA: DUF1573 domain-containing protein [Nitrospirota bacterium]|nr:DUF1573 domain-containing protein [Nitrospirota bacterium]
MKRLVLLVLLLSPALAIAEPSIVFQTEKHDFGTVVEEGQLDYSFSFTNMGTDTLIIEQVNTS